MNPLKTFARWILKDELDELRHDVNIWRNHCDYRESEHQETKEEIRALRRMHTLKPEPESAERRK